MIAWVGTVTTFHRALPSLRGSFGAWIGRIAALLRDLGPYAAIELVLPGGSVIALLLWLYRRDGPASGLLQLPRIALGAPSPMSFSRPAGSTH
jgi:hypothetical protein